ncbi:hypothetical protein [Streptomyces violens]|uniref:hypothetical protein n=1 Tax=Streptomyces violens TaxID=66377 RepID=UPI0004C0F027|nr:hypothetical protein [Streptomyces violens]
MPTITETERDPLEIALDAIPAFRKVQTGEAEVQQRIADLRNPGSTPQPDLVGETLAALDKGESMPKDLGRRAWETRQAAQFTQAELQLLLSVADRLKHKREQALHAGADTALTALRGVLDELLAEARPMAETLRSVHDAQTAIDHGPKAVAAWSQFNALADRYKRIRAAQDALTRAANNGGESIEIGARHLALASVLPVWSEIANVTEVWPEYTPERRDGQDIRAPWPVPYPQRPFDVRHDREWLMWLLTTPGVRLWLPTLGELREAYAEQRADAVARGGESQKDRSGEPIYKPTRYKGGDGSEWTEFQKIEA